MKIIGIVAICLGLFACFENDVGEFRLDGGRVEADAGQPDAGELDGGRPEADAGQPDAGQPDAGALDGGQGYFVVALQGQSGVKYAATSEGAPGPFNVEGMTRPAITGSLGRYVDKYGDKPNFTTVSLANGGLVDLEINDFNFHNRTNQKIVPRGAYAVATFMKFMAPNQTPVFLTMSKVGTAMDEMMDNNATDRSWINAQNAIDYVEANYGPIDLYVHSWYGSEPAVDYRQARAVHWMGEQFDGTKHILGLAPDNTAPGASRRAVDRYLFEVTPGSTYDGLLPYNDGNLKVGFVLTTQPELRAAVEAFFADPRMAGMSVGTHSVPMTGHIDDALENAPLIALMTMGVPILRRLGITVLTPKITTMTPSTDRRHVDVVVTLPNGGNLKVIRDQKGIPPPAVPGPTYLPIYGFELAVGGSDANRVNLRASEVSSIAIINPGAGVAPSRTATVRITFVDPLPDGARLGYRIGGSLFQPGLSRSGSTVTGATELRHGFSAGQVVTISGAAEAGYNGSFVLASIPTPYTFTYTIVGTPASPATGAPTARLGSGPVRELTGLTFGTSVDGNSQVDQIFFNRLIEEVPAWRQAGAQWPFPGVEVAQMNEGILLPSNAGLAPLSSITTTGATPTIPSGLAAGDLLVLIAGASGNTAPSLSPSDQLLWTNHAIPGSPSAPVNGSEGPTGSGSQVSFRVVSRVWMAGNVLPTFQGATYVDAHRLGPNWAVGQVASSFENGSGAPVPGGPAVAVGFPLLSAGTSHRHLIHVSARSSGQSGFAPQAGLQPQGFARISGDAQQRTTWVRPSPVSSVSPVTMPVAFGSTNGGGVLTMELVLQ